MAGILAGESRENAQAFVSCISSDGRSWKSPERLPFEGCAVSVVLYEAPAKSSSESSSVGKSLYAIVSVKLSDGSYSLGVSERKNGNWCAPQRISTGICSCAPVAVNGKYYLAVSDAKGKAIILESPELCSLWREISTLEPLSKVPSDLQPQLVASKDGKLALFMRSVGYGWSYRSNSTDCGRTWTKPDYNIPVPDQRFATIRLSDGKLLAVKNGRLGQHLYRLTDGMYAFLSDDDGRGWYGSLVVEPGIEASGVVATELSNGILLIAYNYHKAETMEIRAVVTSAAEIDAATANTSYKAIASARFTALVPGQAVKAFRSLYAQKKKFHKKVLTVGSYNIQYKTSNWESKRMPVLKSFFAQYSFDVFGVQEPYRDQVSDLLGILGDDFDWVGGVKGVYDRYELLNPVFYRKSRLEVLDWGNLWFTEIPDTPGFGAFTPRMCVWVKFRDKASGKDFCLFNSHFDHRGHEAKKVSALLLIDKVKEIAGGLPVFLVGDYNDVEGSFPYETIISSGFIADTMTSVEKPINADVNSEPGYRAAASFPRKALHIDHIFYTPSCIQLLSWELITYSPGGMTGSDHIPIMIQCKLATD